MTEPETKKETAVADGGVRRSISVRLVRHAESQNNQVYRDARKIYKGGTTDFDLSGWLSYVDERRSADPGLSDIGGVQAQKLCEYLVPHLRNQASKPVRFVISPMQRTIQTILPTLEDLADDADVMINGLYFESEGCHTREKVEPGMNADEINERLLHPSGVRNARFEAFQTGAENGWYAHGSGPETRPESEVRAAQFTVWMMEYLDEQLAEFGDSSGDIFDAGVTLLPEEEHESYYDRLSPRTRQRRTAIFVSLFHGKVGHGDFMSLVLKRIVAGFGHSVEKEKVPHRSAFVHNNTGITELEYFGNGRFLVMSQNQVPHLSGPNATYITGGGLKDGWSYLMPTDGCLDSEVSIAYADEVQPHVEEQTEALKSLYLSKKKNSRDRRGKDLTVVVKQGLQVVGCASLDEQSGRVSDVVVRPSARRSQVGKSLIEAVRQHAEEVGIATLTTKPDTDESEVFFEKLGFVKSSDKSGTFVCTNIAGAKL